MYITMTDCVFFGKKGCYDLIINDSTDPFGHTEGLFTKGSTAAAIMHCGKMGSWCISMEVHFMMKMKLPAVACTKVYRSFL